MRPGSVVVDLAADSGGNVEGVVAGSVINVPPRTGSVQLWGGANVPSQMPGPASRLYAQNVLNMVLLMTRERMFDPDFDDEIVAGMCIPGLAAGPGGRAVSGLSSMALAPRARWISRYCSRRNVSSREAPPVSEAITWLTIFVLAAFVGVEVISKVSSTLHTPLMSGANAIHGIILVGAILVAGHAESTPILVLSLVAVVLAAINLVGGFVVTDRMLQMFLRKKLGQRR